MSYKHPQHTPTMKSRLQLHLSARDLKNIGGIMGISDPFAVVTARGDSKDNPPEVIGQTDVVFNNLNPSWSKVIFLDGYKFGRPYYIEVGVFDFEAGQTGKSEKELSMMDVDSLQSFITKAVPDVMTLSSSGRSNSTRTSARSVISSPKNGHSGGGGGGGGGGSVGSASKEGKMRHKMMGTALFEVGEVLGSRGNIRSKKLQSGGAVYVHIEKCKSGCESSICHFQLKGKRLANQQSLGRTSSPFFELYRKVDRPTGATWMSVYRSNVVKSNLNPRWKESELDITAACNGDIDCAMKVMVWDQRSNGKHKSMGELETTMRAFIDAFDHQQKATAKISSSSYDEDEYGFKLIKNGKEIGTIIVVRATLPASLVPSNMEDSFQQLEEEDQQEDQHHQYIKSRQRSVDDSSTNDNRSHSPQPHKHSASSSVKSFESRSTSSPKPPRNSMREISSTSSQSKPHSVKTQSRQNSAGTKSTRSSLRNQRLSISQQQPQPQQQQQQQTSKRKSLRNTPSDLHRKRRPEFIDYLSGGCQISLAVAIDFTASNGDPRKPGTPHYFHPPESKEWNDYEKAIFAVGSILAKYDSDQKFPVWGFGAKYNNVVRHCFQCGQDVEVDGVQGIMDAYRGVFRTPLTMSYPTRFCDVIQTAASYAQHEQDMAIEESQLSYTILLILTAGNIENIQETKDELIRASMDAPLSVVIVGIGEADFSSMTFLDEHDPLQEDGRDITKFVRFRDYKSFNALTEAVLDEIPDQVVEYFYDIKSIVPGQIQNFAVDGETMMKDVEIQEADEDHRTDNFLG